MTDAFYDEEAEKYRLKKEIDSKNSVNIPQKFFFIRLVCKKNNGTQRKNNQWMHFRV